MFCVHTAISERVSKNSEKRVQKSVPTAALGGSGGQFWLPEAFRIDGHISSTRQLQMERPPPGGEGGSLRRADPGPWQHPSVIAGLKGFNLEDSRWNRG